MDIVGGLLGVFVGILLLYMFADVFIGIPGYFIYYILFTKAEYDPDHKNDVDISDARVLATGVIFWLAILGGAYGIYRIAM